MLIGSILTYHVSITFIMFLITNNLSFYVVGDSIDWRKNLFQDGEDDMILEKLNFHKDIKSNHAKSL